MGNVYVKLTETELRKIQAALAENPQLDTRNLVSKIDLLIDEMQPGTALTLEAIKRAKSSVSRRGCEIPRLRSASPVSLSSFTRDDVAIATSFTNPFKHLAKLFLAAFLTGDVADVLPALLGFLLVQPGSLAE